MSPRLIGLAAAVILASLALTGCGGAPAPSGGNTGDNGAATSGPAPADGGDEGTAEQSIPENFPRDEIPLIEGDVVFAQDLGTGWTIYIARDDFLGGYEEAKALLTGAGFSGDTVNSDATGAFGQFTSDAYTVNLQAGDFADLGVGPSVGYTVVKNG